MNYSQHQQIMSLNNYASCLIHIGKVDEVKEVLEEASKLDEKDRISRVSTKPCRNIRSTKPHGSAPLSCPNKGKGNDMNKFRRKTLQKIYDQLSDLREKTDKST